MIKKLLEKGKWVRSPDTLAGLALFFLSLFFFYDLLFGRFLLIERDLSAYFIPPHFFWVESIKHGSFPLWNPYQYLGHPFFANPQQGMLYPLNALFFLLPFDIAFNAIIILHFFLGGLFTYLLSKDLNVQPAGAFLSGLIFMLGGYLLSVHSLLTILLTSIWTPLIILFFRRALHQTQGFKNEAMTAVLITISFLGGGMEVVYGNFLVLVIMVFFSSFSVKPVGNKPRRYPSSHNHPILKLLGSVPLYWDRIKSLAIISVLFLFLSAVQLIPFIELFHHSIRGNGIPYSLAMTWSFSPKDILLFFLPDVYGYFADSNKYWTTQCWFKTLYTGGIPFILSLFFFFLPQKFPVSPENKTGMLNLLKERRLFIALILFSLFLSLGRYNPLNLFVFTYLPFLNGIRYPAKFLYVFFLALSLTAGLGFQRLTGFSKKQASHRMKNLLMVSSFVSGLCLLGLVFGYRELEQFLKLKGMDYPQFNYLSVNLGNAKHFFFYFTLSFLLIRIGIEKNWKSWTKIALIILLTADLFGNLGFYVKEKSSAFLQKTRIQEIISEDKESGRTFSTIKTTTLEIPILTPDRAPIKVFKEKHLPSMNLLVPLHDIWGVDVIRLQRTEDLYNKFTRTASIDATNLIDLFGVKYVISMIPLEDSKKFKLVYANIKGLESIDNEKNLIKKNTIKLYKYLKPFPRAWLVKDYQVMEAGNILKKVAEKNFDPAREVFLEEKPSCNKSAFPVKGEKEKPVKFISETNNRLVLQAEADENCLLFLSDTWYPGWKAFVDGKQEKIFRANYAFRAVPLKAGMHRIEFIYDPLSFKLGAGFTLIGIIGCVVIGLTRRKKS